METVENRAAGVAHPLAGAIGVALLPSTLNGTWDWLEKDLTLVTIPCAGHSVQQDATDMVNRTMKMWLAR